MTTENTHSNLCQKLLTKSNCVFMINMERLFTSLTVHVDLCLLILLSNCRMYLTSWLFFWYFFHMYQLTHFLLLLHCQQHAHAWSPRWSLQFACSLCNFHTRLCARTGHPASSLNYLLHLPIKKWYKFNLIMPKIHISMINAIQ